MLRDYQQLTVDHCYAWAQTAEPGARLCIAAPTGTGKSLVELELLRLLPDWWLVTPRIEIVAGLLQKCRIAVDELTADEIIDAAFPLRIITPLRMRNAMLRGEWRDTPAGLLLDEGHHDNAESWQQLHILAGRPPAIAFTASPYRGTPTGTAKFRLEWGEPVWAITYPEAMAAGWLAMPECEILPLVDDDLIEVTNGELVVSQVTAATESRIAEIVRYAGKWLSDKTEWDRPTMFAAPSRESAAALCLALNDAWMPAVLVTGETPFAERQAAFRSTLQCQTALVQINVVSEGVDLALRRLVDLSPMLSPVKWIQQFGRITRPVAPGEKPPEYVCTNRNLFRHAYLLDGCLPPSKIAEACQAFGGPGKRGAMRVLGLESLGRLKSAEIPLRDGNIALCYSIAGKSESHRIQEYCVIVHPARENPLWATRTNIPDYDTPQNTKYGRWQRCDPPEGLQGFASVPPRPITEKMKAWWKRSANYCGLDADHEPTRKTFQVLPVLCDIKARL